MSPFCEVCETPFVDRHKDHFATCVICGQECCKDCITKERPHVCIECDTSEPPATIQIPETSNDIQTR